MSKNINTANVQYTIVEFPEVQGIMEQDWFTAECYLLNATEEQAYHPNGTYFVPTHRLAAIDVANELEGVSE